MDETQQYSAAEMERMMKVQDVLLKAMAKKITWWAAAEIIGVTDRTMRRWRETFGGGRLCRAGGSAQGKTERAADTLYVVPKLAEPPQPFGRLKTATGVLPVHITSLGLLVI